MAFQGLFTILLRNRANLELTATTQLKQLLAPYTQVIDSPDLKQLCPSPAELQQLIEVKNNIETSVIALQRRTVPLEIILERLQIILIAIPAIITLIKTLPIPNQFTTVGFVTTLSDRLESIKQLVQKYRGEVTAGQYVITNVNATFNTVLQLLDNLDQLLLACAPDQLQQNEELLRLSQSLSKPVLEIDNSYKGYSIEIRTIENQSIAPQRYAVAIDQSGVVVLEGKPSFSSSTQILVDEIKFRIDQLSI